MGSAGPYRVLIVGCGELGSRHLQAVAALPQVAEIEVVDPRPEALDLGRERLGDVPDRASGTKYRWLRSLEEATRDGDLCIVATQAEGRCALVQELAAKLSYDRFLLEKLVSQSVREYEGLLALAVQKDLSIWVNCQARALPITRYVSSQIERSERIILSDVGGNHGLATNGIHMADLFVFFDGAQEIRSAGSSVDPILHPSKRGPGVFDLSGTLHGYSDKGSQFLLSFSPEQTGPDQVSIVSSRKRWIIDYVQRFAWESAADSAWEWRPLAFEGDALVSRMTRRSATEILADGSCQLPTLTQCFAAHRFVLDELLPHFNQLLERDSARCPVT